MAVLEKSDYYTNFCEQVLFIVSTVLSKATQKLYLDSPISQYGLDSIGITNIISIINKAFKLELSPVSLYGHQTVKEAATDLYNRFGKEIDSREIDFELIQQHCEQFIGTNLDKDPTTPEINCHHQIEKTVSETIVDRDYLLVFSAVNSDSLLETVRNVARYLAEHMDESNLIAALELELMSSDTSEKERLAIIAKNNKALLTEMNNFISGQLNNQIYIGEMAVKSNNITMFVSSEEARMYLQNSFFNDGVKEIAALWSAGVEVDWSIFTKENKPKIKINSCM